MSSETHALLIDTDDAPGVLSRVARVIADNDANIHALETFRTSAGRATISVELTGAADVDAVATALRALPVVHQVERPPSLEAIYGKRVIIVGGGAQVGQVAVGAISEADRHNIRGERISVDTIPLVGEQAIAGAVRAVARLPRARVLVLAGAIMGGAITEAVKEIQSRGLIVIALNMVGVCATPPSRRYRSHPGRCHGCDGHCRHRHVRHREAAGEAVLTNGSGLRAQGSGKSGSGPTTAAQGSLGRTQSVSDGVPGPSAPEP